MAEALVIGPLFNLALFLGKYYWKRRNGQKDNIEYDRESSELSNAVESLAQLAHIKATEIQQINLQLGISPNSLENLKWDVWSACEEAKKTLDAKGLKAIIKMQRIQGIHNRLTQLLVFHLGVGMLEGITANVQVSRQILDHYNEGQTIGHMYTFPTMNAQYHNLEHFPHQNLYDPLPPYQLEVNSPGHQQSHHIEVTEAAQPTRVHQGGRLQKRQNKGKPNSPPPTCVSTSTRVTLPTHLSPNCTMNTAFSQITYGGNPPPYRTEESGRNREESKPLIIPNSGIDSGFKRAEEGMEIVLYGVLGIIILIGVLNV